MTARVFAGASATVAWFGVPRAHATAAGAQLLADVLLHYAVPTLLLVIFLLGLAVVGADRSASSLEAA